MSGEILGNYRILKKLGEGGMGAVYLARDLGLEREVALKVIAPELARNQQLMARFRVEAIAQAKLNHSNITAIHSFNESDGHCYIVMEFVDGNTLKNIIKEKGKIPLPEALNIFSQVLEGIAYAHSKGVVHRDIKPSNIFLSQNQHQRVKIGDFGIAKVAGIDGLTKMGSTMGSPLYSSPEQLLGKKTDARTDVYSLGITFYEMVTGTLPIKPIGDSEYKVIREVLDAAIRKPSELEKTIPPDVDTVIMKSLAKSPDERFQSVKEFETAVKELMKTASPATGVRPPAVGVPSAPKPAKMGPAKITAALDKIKSGAAVLGAGDRKRALTVVLVLGIILVLLVLFLITSTGNDQLPQTAHTGSSEQMPQTGTTGTSSGITNFFQPGATGTSTTTTTSSTGAPITTKPLLVTGSDLTNTSTKMAGLIKNGDYSKAVGLGLQAMKDGVVSADVYRELARAYYYEGDKKNARLYYWKTLEVAQTMNFHVFYEYKKNTKADGSLAISKTNLTFSPTRMDMAQLGFSIPLTQIKSVSTDFIGDISGIFKKKKNRDNPTLIIKDKQKQKYQIEVGRADSKLRSFVKDIIDTVKGT